MCVNHRKYMCEVQSNPLEQRGVQRSPVVELFVPSARPLIT